MTFTSEGSMGATEGVGSLASTVGESTGGAAPVDGAAFTGGGVLVIRHVLVVKL